MTLQHTTSTIVLHHRPLLGLCYVYALLPPSFSSLQHRTVFHLTFEEELVVTRLSLMTLSMMVLMVVLLEVITKRIC